MLTYIRKYYYINNYKQPDFQSAELQSIIKMEVHYCPDSKFLRL